LNEFDKSKLSKEDDYESLIRYVLFTDDGKWKYPYDWNKEITTKVGKEIGSKLR